jgi:hypothetical protein
MNTTATTAAAIQQREERVVLTMHDGDYVARLADVREKLARYTKRQLVNDCCDYWPGLLADGTWSRKGLQARSAFELAVILCQI